MKLNVLGHELLWRENGIITAPTLKRKINSKCKTLVLISSFTMNYSYRPKLAIQALGDADSALLSKIEGMSLGIHSKKVINNVISD